LARPKISAGANLPLIKLACNEEKVVSDEFWMFGDPSLQIRAFAKADGLQRYFGQALGVTGSKINPKGEFAHLSYFSPFTTRRHAECLVCGGS
jgi:hypothetical protein